MAKARVAAATLLGAAALAALVFLLQNRRSRRVSVLWLRSALRVRDNEALQLASEAGTDGLLILYIWRFGRVPKTPAQVFECAAVEALQRELAARGNRLQIHACIGDDEQAVVVAQAAAAADASTIIVDASGLDGDAVPPGLEAALAAAGCRARVQVVAKHSLLLPMYRSEHATGRTKNGSKQLRWANWLVAASANKIEPPLPSPRRLPPPPSPMLTGSTSILPDPTSAGEWAKRVLSLWGEVSEEEAVCRAKAVAATGSERAMRLGETARALDSLDADGGDSNAGLAVPSRLSPYLRFGVISPREAYHLGVRKRHLLWRDWSHLCWRYSESLRHGVAVVAVLDGCTRRKQASAEASTRASTQASTQASPEVIPPPPRAASVPPAASLPPAVSVHVLRPEWATDDEAAFAAWATGTTGAPVVDAAMRQLWATGWMTRRARLLCASCLVEGMGGDWRAGRDWFAHTLIDHDRAINECMWQNAGMCGFDPFYRGLLWEAQTDEAALSPQDVETYLSLELRWASKLRHAAAQPRPPIEQVAAVAVERREWLRRNVFSLAGKVSRVGVRVNKASRCVTGLSRSVAPETAGD